MRNNPWKKEWQYGLLFIVLAIASAMISELWALSFLIWSLIYILWKWVEIYYFYYWYSNDAKIDNTPESSGIFKQLVALVTRDKLRSTKKLNKNKQLIQQFKDTAKVFPYATILLNKNHEILWANDASDSILGINHTEGKVTNISDVIRDSSFDELLKDISIEEIKINHPNDAMRKIHIKLVQLNTTDFLLVARDISEQEALRISRKSFVDNASHELRTPLTVISGYLEMLHSAEKITPQWHEAVNQAMSQSVRMENIINDMLKLSSIEHERFLQNSDEEIAMPFLLNSCLNDVKNSKHAKLHHFNANIDSELKIKGNQEDITSVVLNLLNNAVVHTKKDTQISLKWFKNKNTVQLWVYDDGGGIESKHLAHLTQRFYRVDNSTDKNTNSTGLGLAIVKQICDNHNAMLEIDSQIGQGTCFKIAFRRKA